MVERTRLSRRMIRALIALAVIVVGLVALELNVLAKSSDSRFVGGPPPTLFSPAEIGVIQPQLTAAQVRAQRAAAAWLAKNPGADDAAFSSYAIRALPPPPAGAAQRRELALLHRVQTTRSPPGYRAAQWLGFNGKKAIWKLFRKQYEDLASPQQADAAKALYKRTLALADSLETATRTRFNRPSPYQTDPSLHAIRNESIGKTKASYPSKHTTIAFAALGILSHLEPPRTPEYEHMAAEVAYSRLYAGVHYPSDLVAGAYLGTLVAQYELHHPAPAKSS